MALIVPLLIISIAALGALAWAALGLPALLGLTYGITEFCQSLLVRCVEYSAILKVVFLWAGFLTLSAGLLYGLTRGGVNLFKTLRAVKRLPIAGRGASVVLIRNRSKAAFTHGFLNPRIYISTGLLASLERDEKKAVFLHELHHRRRLDPLRFFLLNILKDSFFYIPAVKYLASSAIAKGEHEADLAGAGAGPLSLASALVKVASFNRSVNMNMQASITGGDGETGSGSMTARVESLIEGTEFRRTPPSVKTVTVSVLVTSLLSLSLTLPLLTSSTAAAECSTGHCAMHMDRLGNDCRTHCEAASHRRHAPYHA